MQDPLSRIDLNLLVALQVLIQEKNVTRAAERLFVTQPAMSKTLNRLRNLLEDELFVRSSHGLIPTPKTLELEKPVDKILSELTDLMVTNAEFDPTNSSATISVATLGATASVGMPGFLNRLRKEAPDLLLATQNIDRRWEERLRSGNLDFAIVAKNKFSDDLITHKLIDIRPVIYMRKDHPLAKENEITIEQRQGFQHMAMYFPNFESTRDDMKKLFSSFGILSKVPFLTTNLVMCLETLLTTDMLLIASDRLQESSLVRDHFVQKKMAGLIDLKIHSLSLAQHVRTQNSPLHQWLTNLMLETFAEQKYLQQFQDRNLGTA